MMRSKSEDQQGDFTVSLRHAEVLRLCMLSASKIAVFHTVQQKSLPTLMKVSSVICR